MKCQRRIALSVQGEDANPADVARELGLAPAGQHSRGESFTIGAETYLRVDGWCTFTTNPAVSVDEPFEVHAEWLLDRLEPHADLLASWVARGWHVRLRVTTLTAGRNGGPNVSPELMGRLAALGLRVAWTTMFAPEHSAFAASQPYERPSSDELTR